MNSYGQGGLVLSASILPATSAFGFAAINHAHPVVVVGLLVVSIICFMNLMAQVSRFMVNVMKNK